jgi:hypothetical protein
MIFFNIFRSVCTYGASPIEHRTALHSAKVRIFQKKGYATLLCMTPLCKIEVTPPRVLGSPGVHCGGVLDEQAGGQPSGRDHSAPP